MNKNTNILPGSKKNPQDLLDYIIKEEKKIFGSSILEKEEKIYGSKKELKAVKRQKTLKKSSRRYNGLDNIQDQPAKKKRKINTPKKQTSTSKEPQRIFHSYKELNAILKTYKVDPIKAGLVQIPTKHNEIKDCSDLYKYTGIELSLREGSIGQTVLYASEDKVYKPIISKKVKLHIKYDNNKISQFHQEDLFSRRLTFEFKYDTVITLASCGGTPTYPLILHTDIESVKDLDPSKQREEFYKMAEIREIEFGAGCVTSNLYRIRAEIGKHLREYKELKYQELKPQLKKGLKNYLAELTILRAYRENRPIETKEGLAKLQSEVQARINDVLNLLLEVTSMVKPWEMNELTSFFKEVFYHKDAIYPLYIENARFYMVNGNLCCLHGYLNTSGEYALINYNAFLEKIIKCKGYDPILKDLIAKKGAELYLEKIQNTKLGKYKEVTLEEINKHRINFVDNAGSKALNLLSEKGENYSAIAKELEELTKKILLPINCEVPHPKIQEFVLDVIVAIHIALFHKHKIIKTLDIKNLENIFKLPRAVLQNVDFNITFKQQFILRTNRELITYFSVRLSHYLNEIDLVFTPKLTKKIRKMRDEVLEKTIKMLKKYMPEQLEEIMDKAKKLAELKKNKSNVSAKKINKILGYQLLPEKTEEMPPKKREIKKSTKEIDPENAKNHSTPPEKNIKSTTPKNEKKETEKPYKRIYWHEFDNLPLNAQEELNSKHSLKIME